MKKMLKMARFINREHELAALNQQYAAPGASLVIIYGRRRVGKTTLIKEFIKERHALYFIAEEEDNKICILAVLQGKCRKCLINAVI